MITPPGKTAAAKLEYQMGEHGPTNLRKGRGSFEEQRAGLHIVIRVYCATEGRLFKGWDRRRRALMTLHANIEEA